jgi:hypothetical protein
MMAMVVTGSAVLAADTTPTDFKADYMELDALKQKLADGGLEVLGTHQVAGSNDYTVVVYTSKDLKKAAELKDRGFIAALHILHNSKDKEIVASNPEYFMRAFLQKDYKDGMAKPVNEALEKALGKLTPTADFLKTKKLKKYKFMVGMPNYDDFVRVGKGTTAELLKKLQANAKGRIVFTQKLKEDGSALLCGVALPAEIEKFNEKIDTMKQSHLLPYSVLIENGEARIMHAKFYLALSFPRLTMGEFMKIMSIPGDIKDEFKTIFK